MRQTRATTARPRLDLERLEDRATPATLPSGFTEIAIATGLSSATAMEVAPNGDLWVLEQGGAVKRFRSGSTTADVVGNVALLGLRTEGERGLLGIAFHPNHATNKLVFLYYTTSDAPNPHNRVSRFQVDDSNAADYAFVDTVANPATYDEVEILNLDALSTATNHNGGAIHFGPDGKLYVAIGDNANTANAQSLATRHGKILRINANGTIPADNPTSFAGVSGTTTGANRAIWALGLRNPFTFTFDPDTGVMFINDVGAQTWEEVNVGGAGRNFGWPATEGHFNPAAFPGFTNPRYAYSHGTGTFQGQAITGGAFYSPPTDVFPPAYAGDYFFADFVNDWINVMNADGTDVRRFATDAGGVVDLKVTASGSLLYLSRVNGQVFEVTFPAGLAPNITDHPDSATVATGQNATFTVTSRGASPLAYQWQKFNGSTWEDLANGSGVSGVTTARLTLAAVDMADAGQYRVVVTNDSGSDTSAAATLTVVFGARVNFQPSGAGIPAGYVADSGAVFADRGNGHSYGWNADISNTARDRNSPRSPDQRFDTFVQTQRPVNPDAVWELAVPDGTYRVRVVAGDPIATTGVYRIDAEGVRVVRGIPSSANPWVGGTAIVSVTDGRLTLRNAPSARDTRLAFVVVTRFAPAGLVAAYRFNEGSGTTTADAIGGAGPGTLRGGVTRVNGFTGRGLAFDGSTGRVLFGSDLNQWLGTTGSLSFRIRTTQTGNDSVALAPGLLGSSAGDANDSYWGWLDGSGRIGVQAGDATGATSADPINDSLWHHVVLTRDSAAGAVEVYVDGNPSGSATGETGTKTAALVALGRIAHPGGSPAYFTGVLDDLAVFDRVLTADEVRSLA